MTSTAFVDTLYNVVDKQSVLSSTLTVLLIYTLAPDLGLGTQSIEVHGCYLGQISKEGLSRQTHRSVLSRNTSIDIFL